VRKYVCKLIPPDRWYLCTRIYGVTTCVAARNTNLTDNFLPRFQRKSCNRNGHFLCVNLHFQLLVYFQQLILVTPDSKVINKY
jgi:hypothetical protein